MNKIHGIGHIIEGFPYPERHCPYCEQEMRLVNALHIPEEPWDFKAVFVCYNDKCPHYDKGNKDAYVRIYYSSQTACDKLTTTLLKFFRPAKEVYEGPPQRRERQPEEIDWENFWSG